MSQQDSNSKTIDGCEYVVFMLPPKRAKRILIRLSKILMPALGKLVDSNKGISGLMESETSDAFSSLGKELAERLDPDELEQITEELAKYTHANGVELTKIYDQHFKGKLGNEMQWFIFALKVNFENFFSAWTSGSSPGAGILEMVSPSLNISTG